MRAIIKFIDGGFVNVPADKIDKKEEWITVRNGKNLVGLFDEGIVNCVYLSDKKGEKNDLRKFSADKN